MFVFLTVMMVMGRFPADVRAEEPEEEIPEEILRKNRRRKQKKRFQMKNRYSLKVFLLKKRRKRNLRKQRKRLLKLK